MKLAFSEQGRYADFDEGYALYCKRTKKEPVDEKTYRRIIRKYFRKLNEEYGRLQA